MKNRYLIGLVIFLFSTAAFAKEKEYLLSVSLVGMSMDYSEYLSSGELFDTEKSDFSGIVGVELGLTKILPTESRNYAQVGISYMSLAGETQYIGGIIGSGLGYGSYLSGTLDNIIDTEIEYVYTSILENDFEISYGIGAGYREWRRELSATQIEIYSWYSLRPKIALTYKYNDFSVAACLEYQYGLNPEMSFDIPGTYAVLTLGAANITKLTLPLKYKYSNKINLFSEYVYEKQIIEKSNVVEGWLEPRSEAYNQYLKFGAEFKF